MFYAYFNALVKKMKERYPDKNLLFVLDNLWAHKSSLIMKVINNEDNCFLLFTPSNSPELSPIENMFSFTKKRLRNEILPDRNLYAKKILEIFFNLEEKRIQKFFRRTLGNIQNFWMNLERQKIID